MNQEPDQKLNSPDAQATATENPGEHHPEEMPAVVEMQTLTPEQLEELKERAAKADEMWERLLRQAADFENFKKRAARDRQEAIRFANEGLLMKLLPILDNFEMALAATATATATDSDTAQSLQTGVNMIYQQFKNTLLEAGLEEIDATNQPFDPNLHDAVSQEETGEIPEGHVVRQIRKGFKLRDRLIRPAAVVVAKQPAAAS